VGWNEIPFVRTNPNQIVIRCDGFGRKVMDIGVNDATIIFLTLCQPNVDTVLFIMAPFVGFVV
jgi:hypothetical protein